MSEQKDLDHGEFRHPFPMEKGSDQSGESLTRFRFIEPAGNDPFRPWHHFRSTFPYSGQQANRRIQVIWIEIHHRYKCCFRQKGKGKIRGMVSAGNPDSTATTGLDCLICCHAISSSPLEFGKGTGMLPVNIQPHMNSLESCLLHEKYSPELNLPNTCPCPPTMLIVAQLAMTPTFGN